MASKNSTKNYVKTSIVAILVCGFFVAVLSRFDWSVTALVEWVWNAFMTAVSWTAGLFDRLLFGGR